MRALIVLASLASTTVLAGAPVDQGKNGALPQVGDFALLDQNGEFYQLSRYRYKKALVIMSYDDSCASNQQALQGFEKLRKNWADKDVGFMLMNSKVKQDRNAVREAAKKNKIDMPILMDHAQLVAEMLGMQTSGSVVVLDTESQKMLYRGQASEVLDQALQSEVSGAPSADAPKVVQVSLNAAKPAATAMQGCPIDMPAKASHAANVPDYAKDVAPIIEKNCAVCHHDGGIGPFSMNSYNMMKGWSPMIREVLLTKRMPPMQVDPNVGHFSNARYISDHDLQTLVHWVDAGAPRGNNKADPLAALHFGTRTDWQLGKPDYIVTANTHEIPATGVLDYINDEVALEFPEDRWVKAVQFIPGEPGVLHHLLTYVTAPHEAFSGGESARSVVATHFLEGYAPGKTEAMTFPADTGVFIPKGHKLTMQFHYTPNGRATKDTTVIGLYFYDKAPKYEYLNSSVAGPFKIPPNARDYKVKGDYVFKDDVVVYGLRAHMHFRGHDMKFLADMPDGTTKELLSVPNYSYAWQPTYQLVEPVALPAGTKVHVTGAFDNSKYNPANPDPNKELGFGLQSFDEMFIGYWSYTNAKASN
jgi:peroxiredoxin